MPKRNGLPSQVNRNLAEQLMAARQAVSASPAAVA
jgi:hypothetical protein